MKPYLLFLLSVSAFAWGQQPQSQIAIDNTEFWSACCFGYGSPAQQPQVTSDDNYCRRKNGYCYGDRNPNPGPVCGLDKHNSPSDPMVCEDDGCALNGTCYKPESSHLPQSEGQHCVVDGVPSTCFRAVGAYNAYNAGSSLDTSKPATAWTKPIHFVFDLSGLYPGKPHDFNLEWKGKRYRSITCKANDSGVLKGSCVMKGNVTAEDMAEMMFFLADDGHHKVTRYVMYGADKRSRIQPSKLGPTSVP